MWLRQKESDYGKGNVIMAIGICNALFYIFFTLKRKQQLHFITFILPRKMVLKWDLKNNE